MKSIPVVFAVSTVLLLGGAAPAQNSATPAAPPAAGQGAARATPEQVLRQVLSAKDPAAKVKLIKALRALRDPALAPMFGQMTATGNQQMRAEAILGLAELPADQGGGLDLLPVRKLDPIVQAYVLSEAIEQNLVKNEQLEDLARWPDLQPGLMVSIAGRLVAEKRRVDPARLKQIATDPSIDPIVATASSILLAQLGNKDAVAAAKGDKILASKAKGVSDIARHILKVIRERKLGAGVAFAQRCMELHPDDKLLRFEAVSTILVVEPSGERAAALLQQEWKAAKDVAERTRLALATAGAALERDAGLPGSALQLLKKDSDPVIAALGAAAEATISKTGSASAFAALVASRSGPALGWALRACEKLPADEARATRLAMVTAALTGDEKVIELMASEAAHGLALTDPGALEAPLKAAIEKRDDPTAGRLLAAALRSNNAAATKLATVGRSFMDRQSTAPVWPSPGVEAIATMLTYRHATGKLSPAAVEQLMQIATGSGGLPESSRVQAAWIALKGSTDDKSALSRVLADLGQ